MRRPHPLLVLLLLFALAGVLHNWATPIFEAPDEAQHYAYLRWIVRTHTLPPLDDDRSGAAQEVAQPPLYYVTAALLTAPLDDGDLLHHLWHNPGFGYQAPITRAEDKNMLIHPSEEFRCWEDGVLVVHLTRLVSLLFGMMTVAAAWGIGWEMFGSQRGALTAAALVALQPQFVFISSVVSNDSAAAAFSAIALWLMMRLLRRGVTAGNVLALGMSVGAAAATKTSALPLLLPAVIVVGWRTLPQRWRAARSLLLLGVAAALVGLPWYLRNLLLYGDPLGLTRHVRTLWGYAEPLPFSALVAQLPTLWRSFWGAYGWGHVGWPLWVYWLLLLELGGALLYGWIAWHEGHPRLRGGVVLSLLWWGMVLALLLYWMRQVEAPHGRLLFPALGAWAALIALGLEKAPKVRVVLLGTMASLMALAPGARLLATFAPPRLLTEEAALHRVNTVTKWHYGDEAQLLGFSLPSQGFRPGEEVRLRLCWEALRPMTENYTLFVHVLGPRDGIIAARHTWPGNGRYPTSLWEVERPFCDDLYLRLPQEMDAPMRYWVEVGLFEQENGRRLEAHRLDGSPITPPIIGPLIVRPSQELSPPAHTLEAVQLGDAIALRGYDSSATAKAGASITVTLHWEALAPPGEELTAFVHLWREGDPYPLAQDDAPPRGGWFPTSLWERGDRIPDTHVLRVPADLPPGRYPLWAGLYRSENGQRLPARQGGEALPYDLVPLGEIEIEAP